MPSVLIIWFSFRSYKYSLASRCSGGIPWVSLASLIVHLRRLNWPRFKVSMRPMSRIQNFASFRTSSTWKSPSTTSYTLSENQNLNHNMLLKSFDTSKLVHLDYCAIEFRANGDPQKRVQPGDTFLPNLLTLQF